MALIKVSTKGQSLTCSELDNNFDWVNDLGNATGILDCAKISQSSLTTCLSANSVITTIKTDITNNTTAIGEVAQDLIDAQTALQNNINNLTTLIDNQNITISDQAASIASLISLFSGLEGTVAGFNSRLLSVEGRLTTLEAALASGIILAWVGTVASIPSPYRLCNGTNGTPNLVDRFIIGAGASYAPNVSGGSGSHIHSLTGTTSAVSLTVDQMPAHSHAVNDPGHIHMTQSPGYPEGNQGFQPGGAGSDVGNSPTLGATTGIFLSNAGSNGAHDHTFAATTATTNNLPPYYALCYIMKI